MTPKAEAAQPEMTADTELVFFRWKRFKQLVTTYMEMTDKQLAADPTNLEASIGAVMDALDFILYRRGKLHHGLSRKAKRHGINPAKFGWGFNKRTGLSDEDAEVGKVIGEDE